jgi:hypothetical protein
MNQSKHIIHCVNLEIEAPDTKTARQVQENAIRILKNDILPAIEKYLDSLETGNQSLRLSEFNLNFADIRPENFEAEFATALVNKFRDQIEKLIDPQPVSKEDDEESVKKLTKDESEFERFLYFLRTGRLPWWSSRDDAFPFERDLLLNPLLKNQSYRRRLITLLSTNEQALERLLFQFQDEFVVKLIVSAVTEKHPEKVNPIRMLKEIAASGINLKEKLRSLISEFQQTSAESDAEMRDTQPEKKEKPTTTDQDTEKASETFVDGLFVQHAGLVLLHPFLEYFFMEFKLLKDQKFVNRKSQTTAIHLLHYLATGQESPMEYELLFEKYICGWDLNQPVPRRLNLSKAMKAESEKLLNAAIGHWKALKKTSPDGLRESFLQRNGKLILDDFQHRLIVEGDSIDVLLSSLPWGYGMIKLPWLAQILIVDWNH